MPRGCGCLSQNFFTPSGPRFARTRIKRRADKIKEEIQMLWLIFIILLVMWMLGMVTSYTFGGFLHLLLVIAIAAILIRVIQGRRPI
jgi:hypothetical protein